MMKSFFTTVTWLLTGTLSLIAVGAPTPAVGPSTESVLPMMLIDNRPFADVRINGKGPFSFVVDTGSSSTTVSADLAARLHLPEVGNGEASGAGEKNESFKFSHIDSASIGQFSLGALDAPALDGTSLARVIGFQHFDGVLGAEIFMHHVVTLDSARAKLTIQNPADFQASAGALAIPFTLDENQMPVITAKIAGIEGRFQIDTGDRSSLTLFDQFWRGHRLEHAFEPTVTAMTGYGRGGPILGIVGRAPSFAIGGLAMAPPVTRLSLQKSGSFTRKDRAGSIGMGILKRFVVSFDYPRHTMWLVQGPDFALADRYDRSGLWLGLSARPGLDVIAVTPGSPAAKAGIQAGDVLTHAGTWQAKPSTLFEIRRLLQKPGTTSVAIGIASKGVDRPVNLVLQDQIAPASNQQRASPHPHA